MRKRTMQELGRKSPEAFKQAKKNSIVIVLDNVRSMNNVGSIFRIADSFLVEAIYLCGYTPQPPHRDIHKTALGATETVTWHYSPTTQEALTLLRKKNYTIVAVEQTEGSISLENFLTAGKFIVLVFGNEVDGVSDEALAYCEATIEIPQWGSKHSLNVAVATGIVLWQLVQKR